MTAEQRRNDAAASTPETVNGHAPAPGSSTVGTGDVWSPPVPKTYRVPLHPGHHPPAPSVAPWAHQSAPPPYLCAPGPGAPPAAMGNQFWPPPPGWTAPGAPGAAYVPAQPAQRGARRKTPWVLLALAIVFGLGMFGHTAPSRAPSIGPSPVVHPAQSAAPPAPSPKGPRPATGAVLAHQGATGEGVLTINNNGGGDAYLTLAAGRQVIRGVYVRAGDTATVNDVPDGTYDQYFANGSGWNEDIRRFTTGARTGRFDNQVTFTTTSQQATAWTLTLDPVSGGNVTSTDLPPDAIPQ